MKTIKSLIFIFVNLVCVTRNAWTQPQEPGTFRIIGGDKADIEDSSYNVLCAEVVGDTVNGFFGGSIITKNFILTAAHNIIASNMNFVKCYVGSLLFAQGKEVEIAESIVHPHYRYPVLQYDIAIIRLKDNLTFVYQKIQPIALPDKNDIIPDGELCTIAGFGFMGIKEFLASHSLRSLEIPVFNFEKCNELYSNYTIQILPGNICTLHRQKGKDACNGDSGGAVACTISRGRRIVYRVIMFGVDCKPFGEVMLHRPGVHTSVVAYIDWIQSVIREKTYDGPRHPDLRQSQYYGFNPAPYSFGNADEFEQGYLNYGDL